MKTMLGKAVGALAGLATVASILLFAPARAEAAIVLPTANCGEFAGSNCLVEGDFNVFSLPLLNLQAGFDEVPSPGDPYYAPATFGALQDFTIIGINNGQSGAGNITGQVDGSYNTPSNQTASVFSTVTTADPGGAGEFAGDLSTSWDAQVNTILDLTNNTPLVFFFAFNETGSGTGLENTDLLIWGRATLMNTLTNGQVSFFLGGDTGTGTPLDDPLPAPDSLDFGPWTYVHAGLCVLGDDFVGFPDANGDCAVGSAVNQNNLGQNAAAFMVNSPLLDQALLSGNYDVLQITWEMAYINGGGETAWIQPVTAQDTPVPEPGILVLIGIGLAMLGAGKMRERGAHRGATRNV